jgi:hypothetical protein
LRAPVNLDTAERSRRASGGGEGGGWRRDALVQNQPHPHGIAEEGAAIRDSGAVRNATLTPALSRQRERGQEHPRHLASMLPVGAALHRLSRWRERPPHVHALLKHGRVQEPAQRTVGRVRVAVGNVPMLDNFEALDEGVWVVPQFEPVRPERRPAGPKSKGQRRFDFARCARYAQRERISSQQFKLRHYRSAKVSRQAETPPSPQPSPASGRGGKNVPIAGCGCRADGRMSQAANFASACFSHHRQQAIMRR